MTGREPSIYQSHPELTPYTGQERYDTPKEDFKTIAESLARLTTFDNAYSVADVGCANGELLYYLQQRFPHWRLRGYDHTAEFIATARRFPGLRDIEFVHSDLFDIQGQFDIVIATCFLPLFQEVEAPISKLLELCKKGGHVLATGLFNPFDIDVRVEFCDDTRPETGGEWRTDFNRHSQRRVRDFLSGRVKRVEFEPCGYDIDLPHDPEYPIRVWTLHDDSGGTWLINGAGQILNQTLMTIDK